MNYEWIQCRIEWLSLIFDQIILIIWLRSPLALSHFSPFLCQSVSPCFSFSTGFASRLSFDQDEAWEEMQQCYVVECKKYLKIIWDRVECLSKKIFVWLGYFIQLKYSHCGCISFILLDMLALPSVASSEKMSTCQHLRAWSRLFRIIELDFQYSIHNNNAEWNVWCGGPKVDFSDLDDFSISFTFHVVDTHTTHTANNFCQFSFQLFSRLSSTHRQQ